jgi:hypothetical protein
MNKQGAKKIALTEPLARAAAKDAANRNMRKARRKVWNVDDWDVAVREFNRLCPENSN